MITLQVQNAHHALRTGIKLLTEQGYLEDSRNGPVKRLIGPVTTVYERPMEKVVFWPARDANPFFHIYEALWMLAGRNDVEGPTKFVKNFGQYSDDGVTFHGAYGHRWRSHFENERDSGDHWAGEIDQLDIIAARLRNNHRDRRCVLAMHDAVVDLNADTKDQPCNLTATFQINGGNSLDMVVFNRSNDIIWGAYGANAVHFGFLLEYMAMKIGVTPGRYWQISVNYHAYKEPFKKCVDILKELPRTYDVFTRKNVRMPYDENLVDADIETLLQLTDEDRLYDYDKSRFSPWGRHLAKVLTAHELYRMGKDKHSINEAMNYLRTETSDWGVAATQWLSRRLNRLASVESPSPDTDSAA